MALFKNPSRTAGFRSDPFIQVAARMTEQAVLECLTERVAFWSAYDRKRTEELDRAYPGYRDDLNRQRAAVGLPPI